MLYLSSVRNLVMQRQCLDSKADQATYDELFRLMSPVQTPYWCRPGSPPSLVHRADFDEYYHVFNMRSNRVIVKGRFQGGGIAYVFADELPLFASLYSKDRRKLSLSEIEILELLLREGPMNIRMIKDITGILSKHITPVLHRLQRKFLVFEDQADNEWDRAWYPFETEFPDVDIDGYNKSQALRDLVMRFVYLNVFVNIQMFHSFYRFPVAEIQSTLSELEVEEKLKKVDIGGEQGYVRNEDLSLLAEESSPGKGVYVLHRNDYLVKSNEYRLVSRFSDDKYHILRSDTGYNILQFILLDGEFRGFVAGFFKMGPNMVEDVILDREEPERSNRKQEILEAVRLVYEPEVSPVKRYCGNILWASI